MKYFFTLSVFLTLVVQLCHSQDRNKTTPAQRLNINKERADSLSEQIPRPLGFTSDFDHVFTDTEIKYLDSLISAFERSTTVQIAVATIDTTMTKDVDFEDYTLLMMRTWGVGQKGKNNGILIAISRSLRRIRIENGYGIENFLSDPETKYIIDKHFIPKFKQGKYFEGTRDGIIAIMDKLKQNGIR